MPTRTYTRVHTEITFANPYLICDKCKSKVTSFHDNTQCGCNSNSYLIPCEHSTGIVSKCPSWSPVDGCTCKGGH